MWLMYMADNDLKQNRKHRYGKIFADAIISYILRYTAKIWAESVDSAQIF